MSNLKIAGAVLLGGLWLGGCATQGYVDKQVAGVQTQVTSVQGQLRDQDGRIGALDQTTREALERAQAAGKLAEGKFVYSMVLSDDTTKFPLDGSTLSAAAKAKLADFSAKLKADDKLKRAPVVVLTTTDDQREIQRCYALGCNVYITKPVEYETFSQAIRQLGLFLSIMQVPEVP